MEEIVARIDNAPGQKGPRVVDVHASIERPQTAIPLSVQLTKRFHQAQVSRTSWLGLHPGSYHIQWIEYSADTGAKARAGYEITKQFRV